MWPQFVLIAILFIGLVFNIVNEGEPTERNFDTMNYIIKYGFIVFLLYMGGFFDCFF